MQTSIKSRITLGLVFLFVIIVSLSGVGGYFLYQVSRSTEATLHDNYRSVTYAQQMADALTDLHDVRLTDGAADAPAFHQAEQTFARNLTAEQLNITEPGEGQLADSLAMGFRQYLALAPAAATASPLYRQLRQQAGRVASLNLRAIERQSQRTRRIASRTITTLALLAAVGILATFSFIFSFPDYVTKPMQELTTGISRLKTGDYSQRLPIPAHDELAGIARVFNEMAQKLEGYEATGRMPHIDSSGPLDIVVS